MFRKRLEHQWTHDNGTNKRQIDYWRHCVRKGIAITNAEARDDITIGADHRAVVLEFTISGQMAQTKTTKNIKTGMRQSLWGWEPINRDDFEEQVSKAVEKEMLDWDLKQLPVQLELKCQNIETILVQIGSSCQKVASKHGAE